MMQRLLERSAMRPIFWLFAACLAFAPPARAADTVDLTLVLVTDVSRSIDDSEFKLEKEGYAAAFTSRQVIDAIQGGNIGAIAVAYVEFASSFEVRTVLDWSVIRDQASAQAFADKLEAAPRSFWGRTAISSGIDRGRAVAGGKRLRDAAAGDRRVRRRHQQRRPRRDRGARRRSEGRHHHQRPGDHQRPSGVVDLCPCPAAGRPAELLSGKCHWRSQQLRAGGA